MSWLVSSLRPVTGNRSIQIFRCACAFGKTRPVWLGAPAPDAGLERCLVWSPVESVRWSQSGGVRAGR